MANAYNNAYGNGYSNPYANPYDNGGYGYAQTPANNAMGYLKAQYGSGPGQGNGYGAPSIRMPENGYQSTIGPSHLVVSHGPVYVAPVGQQSKRGNEAAMVPRYFWLGSPTQISAG